MWLPFFICDGVNALGSRENHIYVRRDCCGWIVILMSFERFNCCIFVISNLLPYSVKGFHDLVSERDKTHLSYMVSLINLFRRKVLILFHVCLQSFHTGSPYINRLRKISTIKLPRLFIQYTRQGKKVHCQGTLSNIDVPPKERRN